MVFILSISSPKFQETFPKNLPKPSRNLPKHPQTLPETTKMLSINHHGFYTKHFLAKVSGKLPKKPSEAFPKPPQAPAGRLTFFFLKCVRPSVRPSV